MSRRWSLARRLNRIFLGTTLVFIAAISIASAEFLWRGVAKQVDALANEEVAEASAQFMNGPFDPEAFRIETAAEQRRHPENKMGWRVWPNGADAPPLEFGYTELLQADSPRPHETAGTVRIGSVRRTLTL